MQKSQAILKIWSYIQVMHTGAGRDSYSYSWIAYLLCVPLEEQHLVFFLIAPFGRDASCEAPRVMLHCTGGWSLRWFHHRLVGIVGTLCTHLYS